MGASSKNIVLVVPFFSLGGAETQAFNVAKGFVDDGHKVSVLAFSEKSGLLRTRLKEHQIHCDIIPFDLSWIHQKGFKKFTGLLSVIFFLRKLKPDFLFPFTYYPNVICASVWRLTGAKKCFWNQRGLEFNEFNFIERLAKKSKPYYLSNSLGGAHYIAKRHCFSGKNVEVISNGVLENKSSMDEHWRLKMNWNNGELIYTMVANIYPEKNHIYLLESWQLFCAKNAGKTMRLVLVGYPSNIKFLWQLKAKAFDLNINNIEFIDSSNDIPGLLAVTHCGILTSEREGCPNSVLEMMQQKVPVIVSKIPATEEIFGNEYPFFCNLASKQSLVNVLEKTFDADLLGATINSNYELVMRKYSLRNLKKRYSDLLS